MIMLLVCYGPLYGQLAPAVGTYGPYGYACNWLTDEL